MAMTSLLFAGLLVGAMQDLPATPSPAPAPAPASEAQPAPRGPAIDTRIRASIVADVLPRRDVAELRPQLGVLLTAAPTERVTASVDAQVDALVADRNGRVTGISAQVRDGWIEWRGSTLDLRAGYGRVIWGRLDEIAPTDVINPIDTARFLLEGRSEARLAVPFARARFAPSDRFSVEGVLVPMARRGVFDEADEDTSPFNLMADAAVPPGAVLVPREREQRLPARTWRNVSGGAKTQVTAGRVDVAASIYRGFDAIGPVVLEPGPVATLPAGRLVELHPRFTMMGVDAETVTGPWAWRAEIATFVDRTLARVSRPGVVRGRSLDAGLGVDRRVGDFHVFGSAVVHREWSSEDPEVARTDVNLVGSIDRTFGRDRYLARAFVVVNPGDAAAFLRGVLSWRMSDPLFLEASAGTFTGTSDDTIGQFRTRDFLLLRLRCDF